VHTSARLGCVAGAALAWLAANGDAAAVVVVTDPDDASVFLQLFRPTGKFDETGMSGFEFLVSSRTNEFRAYDQYLIAGEESEPATSLGIDLGEVGDLSGTAFEFSIRHSLAGGRNFTFRLTHPLTQATSVVCWGENCPEGATATELLGGIPPIGDYNGLQIQVRAQDVEGASAAVTLESLTGVDRTGADLFDDVVTPDSPGTIDPGRRGQWMLGDDLDLVVNEWELAGTVTLTRPDAALEDLTKVRLAVDLVRHPDLPFIPAPEPAGPLLLASALAMVVCLHRRAVARRGIDASGDAREAAGSRGGGPAGHRDRANVQERG
jgi:hypothetical protein